MICEACQRNLHQECSAQVAAAGMPCDCNHCWGEEGSFYWRTLIGQARRTVAAREKARWDELNAEKP